jgi:hypothetical protein
MVIDDCYFSKVPIYEIEKRAATFTYKIVELFSNVKINTILKGLSHEIFGPVYWPVWMHLGLNKNCFWFLNFEEAASI